MHGSARRLCLAVSLTALAAALAPRSAAAAECHGVSMQPRIEVDGQTLVLNGMGTREATMLKVDVYVAGLYLTERSPYTSAILRDMDTMRIVLRLVRDVERKEMTEALRGGLKRNAGDRMAAFEQHESRLEQLIPDLNDGDSISFTYLSEGDGWLVVDVNGVERGRIPGTDFARTFFAIWLDKPPNEALKTGLLGGKCE